MFGGKVVLKNSFSGSRSKRLGDHRSARRRRRDSRSAVSAPPPRSLHWRRPWLLRGQEVPPQAKHRTLRKDRRGLC